MNVSVLEADKIVVGTNDVSFTAPDQSPTGTAVLNGPVYVGKTGASPNYDAVLNVTSNSAQQLPGDQQPVCSSSLAMKSDGNVSIAGDGKTADALLVSKGSARAATFIGGSPDAVIIQGDLNDDSIWTSSNKSCSTSRTL